MGIATVIRRVVGLKGRKASAKTHVPNSFEEWYVQFNSSATPRSSSEFDRHQQNQRRLVYRLAAEHQNWITDFVWSTNYDGRFPTDAARVRALSQVMELSYYFTRNLAGPKEFARLFGQKISWLAVALQNDEVAQGFARGLGSRADNFGEGLRTHGGIFFKELGKYTLNFFDGLGNNVRGFVKGYGRNALIDILANLQSDEVDRFIERGGKDAALLLASDVNLLAAILSADPRKAAGIAKGLGTNVFFFAKVMASRGADFSKNLSKAAIQYFVLELSVQKHMKEFAVGLGSCAPRLFEGMDLPKFEMFINTAQDYKGLDQFIEGLRVSGGLKPFGEEIDRLFPTAPSRKRLKF